MHAFRSICVVLDDALDVPVFNLLRKSAVGGLLVVRRRNDGKPIVLIPPGTPSEVGELDHDRRAVLMARIDEVPHPGNDLVFECEDVVEYGWAIEGNRRRSGRHRQRNTTLRALDMISTVPLLRHALLSIGGFVRGRHDPIFEDEMLEPIRLEQRIGGHGGSLTYVRVTRNGLMNGIEMPG